MNRPREFSGDVWDAIHEVYAEHAPQLARRTKLHEQSGTERRFPTFPGFDDWSLRSYDWSATYNAESYAGMVGTHSDHLQLPRAIRKRVLDGISSAIADVGIGHLDYRYRTVLLTARVNPPLEPRR